MRAIFADTVYWVAIVGPNDPYGRAARAARRDAGSCTVVTTDEVLCEFVTAFSRGGPMFRERAVRTVRTLLDSPIVKVLAQSRDSFLRALERFSKRPDKEYSLTDCSSMNAMDVERIQDVLTNDHHFQQEGYNVLIRPTQSGSTR